MLFECFRLEKIEQKRQKEYLLKNLEDEKRERREKVLAHNNEMYFVSHDTKPAKFRVT